VVSVISKASWPACIAFQRFPPYRQRTINVHGLAVLGDFLTRYIPLPLLLTLAPAG
jgi:hypothetical protein